jgi:large subunit ribosomal protein L4
MLRGGGRAFGPKPRDFSTELPKKIREMGLRVALSVKLRERRLVVVPSVEWTNWKTKYVAGRIKGMLPDIKKSSLIISGQDTVPEKLEQTTRNLKWVACKSVKDVQVWDILKASHVILSLDAVEWFQENLGQPARRPAVELAEEVAPASMSSDSAGTL